MSYLNHDQIADFCKAGGIIASPLERRVGRLITTKKGIEMGTEVKTKMENHTVKEFWGGDDRGVCLQITSIEAVDGEGFVQLTMEEAAALCNDLGAFIKREAMRRQKLLREQLAQMKLNERTVFNEVSELPDELMAGPELAVMMVSRFCPKTPNAK